jgi:hypothetical protein
VIDQNLGSRFVKDFGVNPDTPLKVLGGCVLCYGAYTGDAVIAKHLNAEFLTIETRNARANGLELPTVARQHQIMDRPGFLADRMGHAIKSFIPGK